MASRLLLGLEFDGEYDPRVRAELEQVVAALQTWQTTVAPNDADFIVGTANATLTAERVATSSSTVRVDVGTSGIARWHTDGGMSSGAAAMMFGAAFAEARDQDQARWPPLALGLSSTASSSVVDHVVMSDGANPPTPLDDGAGNFIYVSYTP